MSAPTLLRRDFLRAGLLGAGALHWPALALHADEVRRRGMACILLWMQGGPSQFETFSPKPGHAHGGETKAIATSVPGIELSDNFPELSREMGDLCLIRSMTSKEGSHPRATYLLHTGYLPTASIKHPTLGSTVACELGTTGSELPNFVRIGQARGGAGGGFLGVDCDPFDVTDPARMPDNAKPITAEPRYQRRLKLVGDLDSSFAAQGGDQEAATHAKLYGKASRLVLSPQMTAFDLSREPDEVRTAYGESSFASGCLLARRLVEAGVPFVEVGLGNWDTHQDNFEQCRTLSRQVDRPFAQLLRDLKQRGRLESTLVVWMGEFGRTPRINPRAGRDHYPRAFNAALAGGGVRGGQVIGATDAAGEEVSKRPVSVSDLFRTLCHSLRIDADKERMSNVGRPMKIVDGGAVVREAFGTA